MHPVVAARIKKYASGPPKWSILPAYVKTKMTAVEKKKAWKYYGDMFSTISKIEKFQSQLKKRYS